jgi:hypothetical protein
MRLHIEKVVTDGAVPARKALLQALVHEIRVEGRDRVVPCFRVPGGADPKVRALARSVPPAGVEPATWWVEATRSVQLSYRGWRQLEGRRASPARLLRIVGARLGRPAPCARLGTPWWP